MKEKYDYKIPRFTGQSKAGVLGYNGAARGMKFWILDVNWQGKLEV